MDQFVLGSWGTSTPEAMSCGKPVLMFYKKEFILRAFGEEPPILNSFSEEDIFKITTSRYSNILQKRSLDYYFKIPFFFVIKHTGKLNNKIKIK